MNRVRINLSNNFRGDVLNNIAVSVAASVRDISMGLPMVRFDSNNLKDII